MSPTHEIIGEEVLFQFDPCDAPTGADFLEGSSRLPITIPSCDGDRDFDSESPPNAPGNTKVDQLNEGDGLLVVTGKGKGVSKPMPIRPQLTTDTTHDLFDMSPSSPRFSSNQTTAHFASTPPVSPSSFEFYSLPAKYDDVQPHDGVAELLDLGFDDNNQDGDEVTVGKGKDRELPPILPPLEFSPTEFGYGKAEWPSPGLITPTPGPSSYGSGYASLADVEPVPNQQNSHEPSSSSSEAGPTLRRLPSRRRSLCSLSVHSTQSLAVRSMSRIKVKFGGSKTSSNLARKLLVRKREEPASPSDSIPQCLPPEPELGDIGQGSCLLPWRGDFKFRKDLTTTLPYANLDFDTGLTAASHTDVRPRSLSSKAKVRSYSSPLPLSALDFIPSPPTDIFIPIPIVIRNYFEEILPREIRLDILASLVWLHEGEFERSIREETWSTSKASSSKNKWVGRDRGIRELVKLSRVSSSWQALVFDGQLWEKLDLHPFPKLPTSFMLRIARMAGPFIRHLDLTGHTRLLPATLLDMTDSFCLPATTAGMLPYAQVSVINLQGCSAITTRALHHLLMRSPRLQKLSLRGLSAATNTTCDILSVHCSQLTSLDLSRCLNLDGKGIKSLASSAISRGEQLLLEELRLSGVGRINDGVMKALGKSAPYLEILDLSYVQDLHNSALDAFVSCEVDEEAAETIFLSSRDIGRQSSDPTKYRRRVTRLRHLSVSSCALLTDDACSNLAHTLPRLEIFEMAGIGAALKDEGLVRLLNTTPFIRRLDLEDACEITDTVLSALTPSFVAGPRPSKANTPPEPGHALQSLIISYASNVTDEALLALIRGCPCLSALEVDNTRLSGVVMKEFVRLCRKRRLVDSKIVAIDCRGIGETFVRDIATSTRPRKGWRSYAAKKLEYVDGRDGEDLKVGQDECDDRRVVLKSFYSWQTVDAVRAAREKRKKVSLRRTTNDSTSASETDDLFLTSGRARWWSPSGGRSRASGNTSPANIAGNHERDGCRIM